MTLVAAVLYEDKAAAGEGGKNFALHQLVLACVADRVASAAHGPLSLFELRDVVRGVPRNGRDNVLKDCVGDHWRRFSPSGQPVIALVDYDRIQDTKGEHALRVAKGACFTLIRKAFRERVQPDERVRLILLRDNLESLFITMRDRALLGSEWTSTLAQVIAKSGASLLDRDKILDAFTYSLDRTRRDALCAGVPSFDYLVHTLATLVIGSPRPE